MSPCRYDLADFGERSLAKALLCGPEYVNCKAVVINGELTQMTHMWASLPTYDCRLCGWPYDKSRLGRRV